MKQCLSVVFLIPIIISAFGQPFGYASPGYRVDKLDYQNSNGEVATTIFRYDCGGSLFRGFWSVEDESRSSVNEYVHDEKGNLVSSFRKFSDGLTSLETFSYDSMGHKIAENFLRSDGVSGSAKYQFEDELLLRTEFKKFKGAYGTNAILTFEYNAEELISGIKWIFYSPLYRISGIPFFNSTA